MSWALNFFSSNAGENRIGVTYSTPKRAAVIRYTTASDVLIKNRILAT